MATVSNKKIEKKMELFVANITKYMTVTGKTKEEMAALLGCNPRTFERKMNDPHRFKLEDVFRISEKLGFDEHTCKESFCFR